jgi:hypothetical protein
MKHVASDTLRMNSNKGRAVVYIAEDKRKSCIAASLPGFPVYMEAFECEQAKCRPSRWEGQFGNWL